MHNLGLARINLSLLLPPFLLVGFSLIAFYTIDTSFFRQQSFTFLVSVFIYFLFLNLDYRIFGIYSKYLYFAMICLLLIVFFVGIEARGSARWIEILGFRVQISEVIKPFFIIVVAHFLANLKTKGYLAFLKTLLLLAPIFFLTLKQPDLGNGVIYLFTVLFMMVMSGFPFKHFFITGIVAALPLPLFYNLLHNYQKVRLTSFLDLTQDPFGSSYNSIQALISIGSGGFWGKGFGNSTQSILRFLPEHHTDFIFATMSENLGFIGGVIILILYIFILYKIQKMISVAEDTFTYLMISGFYFLLLTHIFFNIGMNIGILPIVGITLPFLSYGGSSLITNFIILGLLSNAGFAHKKHYMLEIK